MGTHQETKSTSKEAQPLADDKVAPESRREADPGAKPDTQPPEATRETNMESPKEGEQMQG